MDSSFSQQPGTQRPGIQRPLSVGIYLADQNPQRDRSLGITAMTRSLMQQMVPREDLRLIQLISRSSFAFEHPQMRSLRLPFRTDRAAQRFLADAVHPWMTGKDADLWYYPKGYVSRWIQPNVPTVGTMHDTIVQHYADHYPETRSASAFRYWIGNTKRSLITLDRVLTISQHAASQLRKFCDRYDLPAPEIEVTYEGSSWEDQRETVFEKTHRGGTLEVVHLASSVPHKGTNRLLTHWQTLQHRGRDLPSLLLVGSLDDSGNILYESLRNVSLKPTQPPGDLQRTIGNASALILASEIEGFGLPALEAYYVGTPVCYGLGTSIDEVLGSWGSDGGYQLDDVDALERAIDQTLSFSSNRVKQITNHLYENFSMKKITDRLVSAFRKTVGVEDGPGSNHAP